MEVNGNRNSLVNDILLNIRKSAELIQKRHFTTHTQTTTNK